jgi:SOS response associated peptidase (SRAP)
MCNDFGNNIPYSDYLVAFSHTRIPAQWPSAAPNLEAARRHMANRSCARHPPPGGRGERVRRVALGLPACEAQGSASDQFQVRGQALPGRALLVPASHFFEFTGKKAPKSKWKFTKAGDEWFCFAGLWRPMPNGAGDAFTLLTTAPGPDVAPIHDRQMIVLERDDWAAWLDLTKPEAELLRPLPAGALRVEQVR